MRRNTTIILGALLTIIFVLLGQTTAQETKQITCKGKTVDAKNQPLEGAEVALYVYSKGINSFSRGVNPTEKVTTGSDGSFSFSIHADSENYAYGHVVARKKGLALGWAGWNMRAGSAELVIELDQPNVLAGTVVDENGKPVSAARVSISSLSKNKQYLPRPFTPTLLSTETDSEGKFTFANLPLETTADFVVGKTGYATFNTSMSSPPLRYAVGQMDIKLVLPAESRIEGVVVEKETSKPTAGIRLVVKDQNRWVQKPFDSKEDGTFSIRSLAPGKYTLELLPPEAEPAEWTAKPVEAVLESGKAATGVRIELVKGGVLEVVVTDPVTGKPVENANVTVLHKLGTQAGYGRTGKDGILQIRLMPGDYFLLDGVSKQGYSPQAAEEPFTIVDGKIERREYAIFPDSTLRGVVRDVKGRPLAGTRLMVWPSERQQETVSSAEGKFAVTYEMQNLSNDQIPTLLLCRYERTNLASAIEIDERVRTLDVTLKPGIAFTGNVVDPDGKGVEGARLCVELCKPGLSWPIVSINPARDEATTDKEGKFEIKAIPAGHKYRLSVKAEGYGNRRTEEINPSDAPDNQFSVGNITLAVANRSISGMVVDDHDKPVAEAVVSSRGNNQPYRMAKTNANGKFTLDGICAGRIQIGAVKFGDLTLLGSIDTEVGATEIRIVISENPSRPRYVPKQPPSLVGKPLPGFDGIKIDLTPDASKDKWMLLCFFDMQQRPSRNCITQLARRADTLKGKNVVVVAIQASRIEQNALDEYVKKYNVPFFVGMVQGDAEKTRFAWGVKALPWLILTDREHIVRAEGFGISELEQKMRLAAQRQEKNP